MSAGGTDISTLALRVDALEVRQAKTDLDNMSSAASKNESAVGGMQAGWGKVKTVLAGLALGATAIELVKLADAMSLMDSRLKLATGNAGDFAKAQAAVYKIAQESGTGIAEVTALYTKLHEPVKNLGGTTKETTSIVTAFAAALKVGGASTAEASAATLQFAQAMASGKLQGDEFRSLAEASPRFMKALADGMGVPIEQLKKMGSEGKLTADVVGNALMKSLGALKNEMASMPNTVGAAMTRLTNDFKLAVAEINSASGTTIGIADMIDAARKIIPTFKSEAISAFAALSDWYAINRDDLDAVWDVARGLLSEFWEIAKAAGGFALVIAELIIKSGVLKDLWVGMRFAVAAIQDGVDILGAVFSLIGAQILRVVGYFNESAAALATSAQAYGEGVFTKFSEGKSALQGLAAEMRATEEKTNSFKAALASSSVTAAENSNELSRMTGRASAAGDAHVTLKSRVSETSAEMKRAEKAYQDLTGNIESQIAQINAEIEGGEKLNDAQKARIKWIEDLDGKYKDLTPTQLANIDALFEEWEAALQVKQVREEQAKAIDELKKAHEAYGVQLQRELTQSQTEIEKQREINAAIGATEEQVTSLKQAKYEKLAADAEEEAFYIRLTDAASPYAAKLDQIAANYRTLAGLVGDESYQRALVKQREEWNSFKSSIADGLTDAIVRGLENGKGVFSSMWEWIKLEVKKWIINVPIKMAMNSAVNWGFSALGDLVGFKTPGMQQGTSITDLLSGASSAGSISNLIGGSIGTALFGNSAAYGAAIGTTSIGAGSQAAMLAAQTGEFGLAGLSATSSAAAGAGGASSIMSTIGAAAPYLAAVLAVVAIAKALDSSGTPHFGGYYGTNPDGTVNQAYGAGESNRRQEYDKIVEAIAKPIHGAITGLQSAFSLGSTGVVLSGDFKVEDAGKDGAWGVARIGIGGQTFQARKDGTMPADLEGAVKDYQKLYAGVFQQALESLDLPQWAQTMLEAVGDAPSMEQLINVVDLINKTQTALLNLGDVLDPLGGVFSRLADLSIEAKMELAGMVGGIDALIAKSKSFVQNFYTPEEQAAIIAKDILKAADLSGIGADSKTLISGVGSFEDFRKLADTINPSTDIGLKQIAFILNVQELVKQLGDLVIDKDTGNFSKTIGELASTQIGFFGDYAGLLDKLKDQAANGLPSADDAATDSTEAAAEDDPAVVAANAAAETAVSTAAAATLLESLIASVDAVHAMIEDLKASVDDGVVTTLEEVRDAIGTSAEDVVEGVEQGAAVVKRAIEDSAGTTLRGA